MSQLLKLFRYLKTTKWLRTTWAEDQNWAALHAWVQLDHCESASACNSKNESMLRLRSLKGCADWGHTSLAIWLLTSLLSLRSDLLHWTCTTWNQSSFIRGSKKVPFSVCLWLMLMLHWKTFCWHWPESRLQMQCTYSQCQARGLIGHRLRGTVIPGSVAGRALSMLSSYRSTGNHKKTRF